MPFLVTHLPSTLNQDVSLVPDSSSAVCSAVAVSAAYNKKQANANAPKAKKPVAIPSIITPVLRPVDVLQTLGLAMLPPQHIQQNLASWHWALIRYAYLIEATPASVAPLTTNAMAGDYKHHHMTALSEALGVGCALSYAQAWFRAQVPIGATVHDPIDFDYLLGDQAAPLPGAAAVVVPQVAPNATRQPDCLIAAEWQGCFRLLVVECKGTSGPRATAIGQLGSAMHQLAGVVFGPSPLGPVPIHRHAYATRVSKTGGAIKLYGVDPPDEEGNPWVRPTVPLAEDRREFAQRDEDGRLVLPSPEEVSGRVLRRLQDRTVAWAGAGDTVEESDLGNIDRQESDFGDLAGATSSLSLPDGHAIKVFTGALLVALEAAGDPDPEHAHERRTAISRAVRSDEGRRRQLTSTRLRADDDPERVASVLSDDGLVLRIEVT
jgi:hypothetical protein